MRTNHNSDREPTDDKNHLRNAVYSGIVAAISVAPVGFLSPGSEELRKLEKNISSGKEDVLGIRKNLPERAKRSIALGLSAALLCGAGSFFSSKFRLNENNDEEISR